MEKKGVERVYRGQGGQFWQAVVGVLPHQRRVGNPREKEGGKKSKRRRRAMSFCRIPQSSKTGAAAVRTQDLRKRFQESTEKEEPGRARPDKRPLPPKADRRPGQAKKEGKRKTLCAKEGTHPVLFYEVETRGAGRGEPSISYSNRRRTTKNDCPDRMTTTTAAGEGNLLRAIHRRNRWLSLQ